VLPTILSRCRKLLLRPLSSDNVTRAVREACTDVDDESLRAAAKLAEGSVARAFMLMDSNAMGLHQRTNALLAALPNIDQRALHALGDSLLLNDRVALRTFADAIDGWMAGHLRHHADLARLARVAQVWEKINVSVRETESFNLERKPLVFSVFGLLAEATR
jgi:DNA polymerase-3 subunit delta'